jgi:hypothetical protein
MVKTLFIFSDMEFDEAMGGVSATDMDMDEEYQSDSDRDSFDSGDYDDEMVDRSVASAVHRRSNLASMTDFEAAKEKFRRAGYELPNIVFWNLRGSGRLHGGGSTPVKMHETGAALMSGFSGHLLKLFMDGKFFEAEAAGQKQQITPYQIMQTALKQYDSWKVVD